MDALRQALENELARHVNGLEWPIAGVAGRILAVVLADPTVARWKNIADEVDSLADLKATKRSSMFTVGYCAAINHLRVAGDTT